MGFPGSSAGKESVCNAGDPNLIYGSESSPEKGQATHSMTSLAAQMVKNVPAMWKTWVQSLGWEDPLEEGTATCSCILSWRIPMDKRAWQAPWGLKELDMTE